MAKKNNTSVLGILAIAGLLYILNKKASPSPPNYTDPEPQVPIENAYSSIVAGNRGSRRILNRSYSGLI